ncbi:MAG: hypothetical protein H7Y86_20415 [Rhizobacter sp.]|nr:hypothetical protein [Ferruginibacter sp.]
MKPLFFIFLFAFSTLPSFAQFVKPAEVLQRLGNDRSFSRYAYEMMRYVREKQNLFANDSLKTKYYNKQEKFLARQLLYLESRQDSQGNIFNHVDQTYNETKRYTAIARTENIETANGGWTLVGPTNNVASAINASRGQGRVDRIAFHPTDASTIYAGTPSAGLWKSINAGFTWSSVNSFMPSLSVSGLVVSWSDPNDLYVLTGDGDSNLGDNGFVQGFDYIRPSIGVLKSTDGGLTWNETGSFGITGFYVGYKLIQSPTNSQLLIAATSQGLYRTTNGGASWQLVSPNTDRYYDLEWKPGSSLVVYAASNENFYISSNAGGGFINQDDNFDVPIGNATRIAIAVTPANPAVVYVFAGLSSGGNEFNRGVYKSTNSGSSFIQGCTNFGMVASPAYMHNIAVSPTDANLVCSGSLLVKKNTTGYTTCGAITTQNSDASLSNFVHADIHEMAFNPLNGILYIGSDGGVHKSTDDGDTFTACYNMANTQFYHFGISESSDEIIMGGAQDNGMLLKSGPSTVFSKFATGDGFEIEFYHNSTNQAYFSVNQRLAKSDAGLSTYQVMSGIPDDWYKTIAISHSNSNIVYTSSGSIYKTTNGGTSWTDMGGSGRWAMVTCPSNSNRIYAAGGASWNDGGAQNTKKMLRSDDAGTTWTDLQENTGFPETITKITGIGVDDVNSSRLWVTMGGFTDGQKVYSSTNAGATWTNLSGSLPNVPINCVAVDGNLDVYVGTDIGVFFRSSTMTDWQPFYNFMPRVPVTELIIRSNTIFASTFGRGIWKSETHSACEGELNLNSSIFGYRFYEALNINSSANIYGGDGTEIYYRAQDAVTLTENFRANASTGESFRAWIANCNTGGIPSVTANTADFKIANNELDFVMPFDGKASLVIVNEKGAITNIIAENQLYKKGKIKLHKTNLQRLKGNVILVIDGAITGMINR